MSFFGSAEGMWLIAAVLLLIVEAAVPGLVSIWFAIGSLAAMIAASLGAPLWAQGTAFVIVSVASLLLTRPLAKKYVNGRAQPTNADMIIGKECIITETIDNVMGTGAVKVGGKTWSAVSYDDDVKIEEGTKGTVEDIRGVKTVVRPI